MRIAGRQMGFECRRCGGCCRNVDISGKEFSLLRKLATPEEWKRLLNQLINVKGSLVISGQCPFLRFEGKKVSCRIYEERPKVCRWYPPPDLASWPKCKENFTGLVHLRNLILKGIRFLMDDGSILDPILYAHKETVTIGAVTYYLLKKVSADAAGLEFTGISSITGDLPYSTPGAAEFAYSFRGIKRILRSTWTVYYRTYTSGGTVYPELYRVWATDTLGRLMDPLNPTWPVARSSTAEGSSYATQSGTWACLGYRVKSPAQWLVIEWGYYVSKAKSGASNYLMVDNNTLGVGDQVRATNVLFERTVDLLKTRGGYHRSKIRES